MGKVSEMKEKIIKLESDEKSNYEEYRGKCKELSEKACRKDPTLTLVRGYYWCPIWNKEEAHWWTTRLDGTIYDPTVKQFPSSGLGTYTPFDGTLTCEECGKQFLEEHAVLMGNYATCSIGCAKRLVGL